MGLLALAQGNRHALRQFLQPFLDRLRKRHTRFIVNDLNHANQTAIGIQYRHDQHLFGAVAGAFVHFLQKTQVAAMAGQLLLVINILDVQRFFMHPDITGHALFGDGQLQILERVESGFDF